MKKEREFPNTIIGVSVGGWPFLIEGDPDLIKSMDGSNFEDNTQSPDKYPKGPGVYICTIEFWFEQGYFEGYKADGESEWDFIPVDVREINLHTCPANKSLVANC